MKGSYINRGILLGVLTSVIVIVIAFGIAQATGLVYPPFRLFDFVSRMVPGTVITFIIDTMIDTIPPHVNASDWKLDLSGLVNKPISLTLDQIRARPSMSQYITLSCISNRIGGELISASKWTGLRLKDLLDEAGLQAEAQELYIESVDRFYESVSMEDMMDERTFLVYEMNGEPVPAAHGFPLRIYIPNHYGMKQPK